MTAIHLGYEIPSGAEVAIPLHHTVITGVTRLSGKTTTIEALLSRMPARFSGLVFRTKRGEIDFEWANQVQAFYRPSINDAGFLDWPYVLSLLQAIFGEKMKLEQSFIINAAKASHSLREFYENISASKARATRGFDESIYTNLEAYMELILPQLEQNPFAETLDLKPGLNVMELGHLSEQVQSLVIASCLQEIHQNRAQVITVVPEAWKYVPQSRGNPVKWAAEHLVREGGSLDLWLWLDSQDITRVDKNALKSVGVWIMGVQNEKNEVKRVLDQLPTREKPKPDEIMSLKVGNFWVAAEGACREIYVQPAWMSKDDARAVATGLKQLSEVTKGKIEALPTFFPDPHETDEEIRRQVSDLTDLLLAAEQDRDEWQALTEKAQAQTEEAVKKLQALESEVAPLVALKSALVTAFGVQPTPTSIETSDLDTLAAKVAARIGADFTTVPMAPLEGLKHDFQVNTVGRLAAELQTLDPKVRQSFKWLVAVDKTSSAVNICRGLGLATSGPPYSAWSKGVGELVKGGWLYKDSHGLSSNLKNKVEKMLEPYNPTPDEVNQTIDHLVAQMGSD